jgi:hypothetical protein
VSDADPLAKVLREDLAKNTALLRLDLEDLERRLAQGTPALLTCVAVRSIQGTVSQLVEIANELKGVERAVER